MRQPKCPIQGCTQFVKVHVDSPTRIVFDCPKHGDQLRLEKGAATQSQLDLVSPPRPVSPYKGLPTVEELKQLAAKTGASQTLLRSYIIKIADRFVKEFYTTQLTYAWSDVRKSIVTDLWKDWFRSHYYESCITIITFSRALKRLGVREDRSNKYYLNLAVKQ